MLFAGNVAPAREALAEDIGTVVETVALPIQGRMPSLGSASAWLNSAPLKTSDLRGKVVVVNFWTYTCINSLRALPYVRAWGDKYKDNGLVVLGVHTPEFEFEKNADNVRRAVRDLNIDFPIALDSGHALWRAFKNDYWPALYFVDANGNIRQSHFGEGKYAAAERVIQKLLAESGAEGVDERLVSVDARGVEAAPDWDNLKSPETYLGGLGAAGFASSRSSLLGRRHRYVAQGQSNLNDWALDGVWTVGKKSAVLNKANGRIEFRFHARDLHLVMGPAVKGTSVPFRVLIDGRQPGAAHGIDVDEDGNGSVGEQRMYQLIRQSETITDRQFEIEFLEPGVEVFVFTFG
jgi:thiol-disulfide isomerase/thioredoxin